MLPDSRSARGEEDAYRPTLAEAGEPHARGGAGRRSRGARRGRRWRRRSAGWP
ncbi:MAG: hypothetical protein AVDCRST_MAG59-2790 [uncultured Thermomicrobiales bacterium]|uniref:Uncharacterized protein n=1 Tax=uncultured Thermomicrobiales bacterium TaxID=1645740 RepID=A0A6J4V026_9BACT|nr:MAG: hypothetical protein AVDCRST_MAG59-2790 [uncultured Thermomicrobiales bacterium]